MNVSSNTVHYGSYENHMKTMMNGMMNTFNKTKDPTKVDFSENFASLGEFVAYLTRLIWKHLEMSMIDKIHIINGDHIFFF